MTVNQIKRIGILTGGGDCPGLNAAIRGIGKSALFHGVEVIGVRDGYQGLIENRVQQLDMSDVSGILTRGGTILGTNNTSSPERYHSGQDADGNPIYTNAVDRCMNTIDEHAIEMLFVIGGDGTFSCTKPLIEAGLPCMGVPKTIDNDIYGTDLTIGFTTATRIGTMALDRLHSTGDSHHRVMICELMGRNAGWLALASGLASGSDVILIPEIPAIVGFRLLLVLKVRTHSMVIGLFQNGLKQVQTQFDLVASVNRSHTKLNSEQVLKHAPPRSDIFNGGANPRQPTESSRQHLRLLHLNLHCKANKTKWLACKKAIWRQKIFWKLPINNVSSPVTIVLSVQRERCTRVLVISLFFRLQARQELLLQV